MGSPKFVKLLVVLALIGGLAWAGMNWLRENPDDVNITRVEAPPLRPPVPADPLGR